jgi:hypothetical protein
VVSVTRISSSEVYPTKRHSNITLSGAKLANNFLKWTLKNKVCNTTPDGPAG